MLGVDFRRNLPAARRGARATVVGARLTHSSLWGRVRRHPSAVNMRLQARGLPDIYRDFADLLIRVSNGQIPKKAGKGVVELPTHSRLGATHAMPLGVARGVFPSIDAEEGRPGEYYCSRAAL